MAFTYQDDAAGRASGPAPGSAGQWPPEAIKALTSLAATPREPVGGMPWKIAAIVAAFAFAWLMMTDIVARGVAPVAVQVVALDKRTEKLEQTVHAITGRLVIVEHRLDAMDKRLEGTDKRLEGMDKRLESMDKRLEGVERRLEGVEGLLSRIDGKIERIVRR